MTALQPHPCSECGASRVLHPKDPGSLSLVTQWTLFLTNHPARFQMSSLRSSCFGGGSCNYQLLVTAPLPAEPPGSALPHPSLSGGALLAETCCSLPELNSFLTEGRSAKNQLTNLSLQKLLPSSRASAPALPPDRTLKHH